MAGLLEIVRSFLPLLVTLALVLAILLGAHITLRRRWAERPEAQFQFQLITPLLVRASLGEVLQRDPRTLLARRTGQ